jgi:hypothetical protein
LEIGPTFFERLRDIVGQIDRDLHALEFTPAG